MKIRNFIILPLAFLLCMNIESQVPEKTSEIDMLLLKGEYRKVIDTCLIILSNDSLDPRIYYKAGLAYQNLLQDDKAITSFSSAVSLAPENIQYSFTLAKSYYNKDKLNHARTLLEKLCASDSMNWVYAYYLTSIYMAEARYDKSLEIYERFYSRDTSNSDYLDKIGFAYLRKGDIEKATEMYNKSLKLNKNNLIAIKNLAHLYNVSDRADTAIVLLTRGIAIDSTDMDLYTRRASIFYTINYNRRALIDYLVILHSGDSSKLYLKRAGIGYTNINQPRMALHYLLKAYKIDSIDYETCSYIGQCYYLLNEMKQSVRYYKQVIKILTPIHTQMGLSSLLLAESQRGAGLYKEAIESYLAAQAIKVDPNVYMIIGNLYDQEFNNKAKSIQYYQLFLNTLKNSKTTFTAEYIESIRKRMEYLKTGEVK